MTNFQRFFSDFVNIMKPNAHLIEISTAKLLLVHQYANLFRWRKHEFEEK